jgi:hypothetical protein
MNSLFRSALGRLAAGLVVWVASVEAQATQPVPAAIVLNGITTILGDNRACFRVIFTGGLREEDLMLAEGQSRYGIQLLAVDTKLNTVIISNQGLSRTVPICKTPTLLAGAVSGTGDISAAKAGVRNGSGTTSSSAGQASGSEIQPGDDGQTARPGSASSLSGSSPGNPQPGSSSNNHDASGNNTSGAIDPGSSAVTGSASANDNAILDYHWWAKEAQKIELAREATAQQVMDGTVQPFPLTPLTPPATPAQLVGTNKVYFYFDPLAAND